MLKDKVIDAKKTVIDYRNMTVKEVQKARQEGLIGETLAGKVIMAKLTSCKNSILPFVVELRKNGEENNNNIAILRKFAHVSSGISKDVIKREIPGIRENWIRNSLLSNISSLHREGVMVVHADPTGTIDTEKYY